MLIVDALYRHARERSRGIAIRSGEECVTWSELARRVTAIEEWLREQQVKTLAFKLDNGVPWVAIDLAALAAGVNVVPLPTFFSESQLDHVLADAAVDCLISNDFPPGSGWHGVEFPLAGLNCFRSASGSNSRDGVGKITYTSGSTGSPKGVCLDHRTLDNVASSLVEALEPVAIEKHLSVLPLSTLLENVAGIYAPIIKGIEINVPPLAEVGLEGSSGLDVEKFAAIIETTRPDSLILVPELLVALTTLVQWQLLSPNYLKMVAVGGGRVSTRVLELASTLSIPVFEGYGLSEACSVVSLNLPSHNRQGSVGRPLPHARLRINPRGEIEVGGSLMTGYLNGNRLDQEWLATGDLGHIDNDGFVYVDGRIKNLLVTGWGRNVNPEWVESELAQNPEIAHALLVGDGRAHNLALVWPRFEQNSTDIEAIVRKTNEILPDFARVGAWIVVDGSLPGTLVTPTGKLRRELVMQHYQHIIDNHYVDTEGESRVIL